jgi:radical SAM superfamily enzyme YgiQ (UPF0313 family)
MKVVLSQFEGIDNTPGLPLASGCLIASARRDPRLGGARFSIEVERKAIEPVVRGYGNPDVLGFSLYPWNAVYSLEVARAARLLYPDALIVAGGPSVPRRPASAGRFLDENPALDVLVFAEGEVAFRELLVAQAQGTGFESIGGIAFRRRGADGHVFTAPPVRILDLRETASPYLDGTFDELVATKRARFSTALLETNRGCPFSCTFCDWSLTKHVEEFPLERIEAELEWIARNGFNHVILTDANFGIRKRDHDIARTLASVKARTGRPTLCYFYLTKNDHRANLETIEILHAAGIGCCVGLAVQDFDDGVLEAVKRDNIQSGESLRLREICAGRGIPTLNELILGLPRQTYASFARSVVLAMPGYPRHSFVIYQCRLLDNTDMASPEERERFGIETRRCRWRSPATSWDPIVDEVQELVVATRDMPIEDWRRTYRFTYLASAAYNARLLRVVLQYLAEELGVDLAEYLAHLGECAGRAPRESVFGAIGRVFDRFLDSILASGPFTLPLESTGDAPLDIADAVAATALERTDAFYAEAEEHTRRFLEARALDATLLEELFRFQSLITPRLGQAQPVAIDLGHDWPGFMARGGTGAALVARPTRARFVPPHYARVAGFGFFATTHLVCNRAGASTGELVPEEPRRLAVVEGATGLTAVAE